MSLRIYLDGQIVDESEAKVSVFDHGLLYGDGVFEGIRAYNGRIFRLDEHLQRLYNSAKSLWLQIPVTMDEMAQIVVETCRANELRDGYIRLVVTRGVGDLGLDPRKCPKPTIFCIAANIELYPEELYETGLRLITCATRRINPDAFNVEIKSLNYLNNIMAKIECVQAGVPEGIMLSADGYVAEGTGDNIFCAYGDTLLTPPVYIGNLAGITCAATIELAESAGMTVKQELFRLHTVYCADEVFLTGTAAEMVAVIEVDGRPIGEGKPGAVVKRLRADFQSLVNSEGTPIYD